MAPLEENRDIRASPKAYVHLSPTPTQKHKVQNRLHTHIIVIATAEHGLLPGREGSLQPLSTQANLKTVTSSVVVVLPHRSCA